MPDQDRNLGKLYHDHAGEWRFRVLDSANGQNLANGEGYENLEDARSTLRRLGVAEEDIEVLD